MGLNIQGMFVVKILVVSEAKQNWQEDFRKQNSSVQLLRRCADG